MTDRTLPDLYAILTVSSDADAVTMRAAYRAQAHLRHPDRGGSQSAMTELNLAYAVLRDPVRRAAYDRDRLRSEPTERKPPWTGAAGPPRVGPRDRSWSSGSTRVGHSARLRGAIPGTSSGSRNTRTAFRIARRSRRWSGRCESPRGDARRRVDNGGRRPLDARPAAFIWCQLAPKSERAQENRERSDARVRDVWCAR